MRSFGAADAPSLFDLDALASLSEEYALEKRLSTAWDAKLSMPEKMALNEHFTSAATGESRLAAYAVEVAAQCLALGLAVATQAQTPPYFPLPPYLPLPPYPRIPLSPLAFRSLVPRRCASTGRVARAPTCSTK